MVRLCYDGLSTSGRGVKADVKADLAHVQSGRGEVDGRVPTPRVQSTADLRTRMRSTGTSLTAQIEEMGAHLNAQIVDMGTDLRAHMAAMEGRLTKSNEELKADVAGINASMVQMNARMMQMNADMQEPLQRVR